MPRFCQAECGPPSVRRSDDSRRKNSSRSARSRVMQMPPPPPLLFRGSVGGQLSEERNVIHLECVLSPPCLAAGAAWVRYYRVHSGCGPGNATDFTLGWWTHISARKQMEMSAFHMIYTVDPHRAPNIFKRVRMPSEDNDLVYLCVKPPT